MQWQVVAGLQAQDWAHRAWVAFPWRAHDHFAIQDCTTPILKNIGTGACEWLIRLLAGGHLRAVTQWPTRGPQLERALDLVVAGLAGFSRDKWQARDEFFFCRTGAELGGP